MTATPPATTGWVDLFVEHGRTDLVTVDSGQLTGVDTDVVGGAGLRLADPDGGTTLMSAAQPDGGGFAGYGCPALTVAPPPDAGELPGFVARWRLHGAAVADRVRGVDPRVDRTVVRVRRQVRHLAVARPDGTVVRQTQRRFRVTVTVYAADRAAPARAVAAVATPDGAEPELPAVLDAAAEAARRAVWHLHPLPAPAHPLPLVLSGLAAGVFIHESVGHGLEADNVLDRGSAFGRALGRTLALPDLTVVDDPTDAGSWCAHRHDDEGTVAAATRLIDRGVVSALLHTRATADRFGAQPHGNARRDSYADAPLARMTTTYALPAATGTEAILRSIPTALRCTDLDGGQLDPTTGRLAFTAREVSLLRYGVAQHAVAPFPVSGLAFELLARISAIGDDLTVRPGICTKRGQALRVTLGAPTIVLDAAGSTR